MIVVQPEPLDADQILKGSPLDRVYLIVGQLPVCVKAKSREENYSRVRQSHDARTCYLFFPGYSRELFSPPEKIEHESKLSSVYVYRGPRVAD